MRFILLFTLLSTFTLAQSFVTPSKMEAFNITVNYPEFTIKTQMLKEGKQIKTRNDLTYLWYKSNQIMETSGGFDGRLLHGYYKAFYLNNQLKEQGEVKYGLKDKEWKYWYSNGQLKEVITWKSGRKNGVYLLYNENGKLMAKSTFKQDKLNGKFFTYDISGKAIDTKEYKNGDEVPVKLKQPKAPKEKKQSQQENKAHNKDTEQKKSKGFFKRKSKENSSGKDKAKPQSTSA